MLVKNNHHRDISKKSKASVKKQKIECCAECERRIQNLQIVRRCSCVQKYLDGNKKLEVYQITKSGDCSNARCKKVYMESIADATPLADIGLAEYLQKTTMLLSANIWISLEMNKKCMWHNAFLRKSPVNSMYIV